MIDRICIHITISVDSSLQPNRITLHIPPSLRIIVAEVVVVQPALRIVVLPGEAQVDLGAALAQRFAAAEGVGLPLPGDLAAGVGGQARGVEVVAMEVEQGRVADLALGVVVGVDGGQRQAVQPQVVLGSQFPAAAVVFGFAEQLAVGAVEVGGDAFGVSLTMRWPRAL